MSSSSATGPGFVLFRSKACETGDGVYGPGLIPAGGPSEDGSPTARAADAREQGQRLGASGRIPHCCFVRVHPRRRRSLGRRLSSRPGYSVLIRQDSNLRLPPFATVRGD